VTGAFGSLTARPDPDQRGLAYVARCPKEPAKPQTRPFTSFVVTEGERKLTLASRPGVFCHGRLDPGTRALLAGAKLEDARRVLDLGCGVGVVGIVAALRCPDAQVTLLDSNARAVQCSTENVAAHGLADRCRVVLSAHAESELEPGFDLVLTNPPYFGNYSIAERFLEAARRLLVPGGRFAVVTKSADWFRDAMQALFGNVALDPRGGYAVLTSVQPEASPR
jgi:16S rRNA (guanine1207-N2)-methyltransferase